MARALIEVETRIGGQLSPSQRQFVILQSKKNVLVSVGKKRKRTTDEEALLRTLQIKIKNGKRDLEDFDERLLIKLPGKSGAQREAKRKAGQTQSGKGDISVCVWLLRVRGHSGQPVSDVTFLGQRSFCATRE